jgi:fucose permease
MGYTATGFWLGVTLGRIMMGHIPTGTLGQKRMVYIYLTLSLFLYLLFWLIPSIVSSSVTIALVGICLGPVYPCTMNVLAKLVGDRELLVAVVGIVGGVGNAGGAIAPFTTGLLAQRKGVSVLQPVILSLVASTIGTWWFLPDIPQGDA